MTDLHVRDVPAESLAALREAARRNGRSLNAEIVAVLVERADVEMSRATGATLVRDLERLRQSWRRRHPDGIPAGLEPEAIVRRLRDAG